VNVDGVRREIPYPCVLHRDDPDARRELIVELSKQEDGTSTLPGTNEPTPGPWDYRFSGKGTEIFEVETQKPVALVTLAMGVGNVDAYARLIAAAPDLLAACKALVAKKFGPPEVLKMADDAITKAEGEER
jgi:hypothetical protein